MSTPKEVALQILENVGGKNNVKNVYHCMTRLRFNLVDLTRIDTEALKNIDGVMGIQDANKEFQVIIGPGVETIYKEFLSLIDHAEQSSVMDEAEKQKTKKKFSPKEWANEALNVMSASLAPLVPLFVVMGIFNTVAVLITPEFLNLVSEESDIYKIFYYVGQAILYFLPILVGYAASKRLGSNTLITMALACFMLYPDFVTISTGEASFAIFGIPMIKVDYTTSIFPIILIAWIQAKIEKYLNKYVPESIKVMVIPCFTVLIMLPIGLCLLGPIGNYLGVGLGLLVTNLYKYAGPLATLLAGATAVISGSFGLSRPIFFVALSTMLANGVEYAIMPLAMSVSNWLMLGTLVAFVLRVKSNKQRQLGISCLIALFFGGVSEPALYGIFLERRKILISTAISGAISGLAVGFLNVGYYVFGPSNFLNVLGFVGGGSNTNFINGIICCAIAFFSALILTYYMDTVHEPDGEEVSPSDNQIVEESY